MFASTEHQVISYYDDTIFPVENVCLESYAYIPSSQKGKLKKYKDTDFVSLCIQNHQKFSFP